MNFLAHSLLGFDDGALVAGQVAGDFVRGTDLSALAPRVALGVRLHRAVDVATDAHPAVASLRSRFDPALRRFAGIAIDVGLDHVIARTWPSGPARADGRPAPQLGAHAADVGRAMGAAGPGLPEAFHRFAPHLVRIMPTWAERGGVAATLSRLSRRSARFAPLAATSAELERLDAELVATLEALWPDLVVAARAALVRHGGERGDGTARSDGGDTGSPR